MPGDHRPAARHRRAVSQAVDSAPVSSVTGDSVQRPGPRRRGAAERARRRARARARQRLVRARRRGTGVRGGVRRRRSAPRTRSGVASGTDAIELALRALDIGPGRRGRHAGEHLRADGGGDRARRRDAGALRRRAGGGDDGPRLRCAARSASGRARSIPVHLYGQCADVDAIVELCARARDRRRRGLRPGRRRGAARAGPRARSARSAASASTRRRTSPRWATAARCDRRRPARRSGSASCASTARPTATAT